MSIKKAHWTLAALAVALFGLGALAGRLAAAGATAESSMFLPAIFVAGCRAGPSGSISSPPNGLRAGEAFTLTMVMTNTFVSEGWRYDEPTLQIRNLNVDLIEAVNYSVSDDGSLVGYTHYGVVLQPCEAVRTDFVFRAREAGTATLQPVAFTDLLGAPWPPWTTMRFADVIITIDP